MPLRHRTVLGAWAAVAAAVLTVSGCSGPSTAPTSPPTTSPASALHYVALGDSYTSGPAIPPVADSTCMRSSLDYPSQLARALGITSFTDVSCSGATTQNFTVSQHDGTDPQYSALASDTTLVTVGIGGNDIQLIQLAESCISFAPPPSGASCARDDTQGGQDVYRQKVAQFAPTYGRVIDEIHDRSPHARIVLVGYPTVIRPGGCYPSEPVHAQDATYLQSVVVDLDAAMRAQARAHGATYVDLLPSSRGHDSCAPGTARWIEGVIPQLPAYPLHPNVRSMRNTAAVLAQVLRS